MNAKVEFTRVNGAIWANVEMACSEEFLQDPQLHDVDKIAFHFRSVESGREISVVR